MKHLFCIPAFLAVATFSAHAQEAAQAGGAGGESRPGDEPRGAAVRDFSQADKDGDGVLSIEEAQEALPGLIIVDINNDGMLNRSEANNAMPDLRFDDGGQADAAGQEPANPVDRSAHDGVPVGETDYLIIVQLLDEQNRRDQAQVGPERASGADDADEEA